MATSENSESSESFNVSITSRSVTGSDTDNNPPSSVQLSNPVSDRLDFSYVEGDQMAAQDSKSEKRKLDREYLEDGELSTDSEFEAPSKVLKVDSELSSESGEIEYSEKYETVDSEKDETVDSENYETIDSEKDEIVDSEKDEIDDSERDEMVDDEDRTLLESEEFGEEFHIVDDVEQNDEEAGTEGEDSNDELDDNEIYAWLEEGIEKKGTKSTEPAKEDKPYTEKQKIILKEREKNHFEVLPEGWVSVIHESGMPVYLHKPTRVCTLAKPYFIGAGSVRKHSVPVSGVPCLQYRRAIEKEKMEATKQTQNTSEQVNGEQEHNQSSENGDNQSGQQTVNQSTEKEGNQSTSRKTAPGSAVQPSQSADVNPLGEHLPEVEIKSLETTQKENSIDAGGLHKYCETLFEFQTITIQRFGTWKQKRKHLNEMKAKERPSLPTDITLLTCPVAQTAKTKASRSKKKEFVLNPVGKTPLCILHEYVQHVLRVQPVYKFKELDSASTPYSATVKISDIEYGTGEGPSKKVAKLEAAKKALDILIPRLKHHTQTEKKSTPLDALSFFDDIGVEDQRVAGLCDKAALLTPYQVLQECLKRNYGMGENKINIDHNVISSQKSELTITVGKHTATVTCKNKREGKQMAAQSMLQLLHPHIKNWGSLVRLYSESTMPGFKEKEEVPVTALQNTGNKSTNNDMLEQLKDTMRKLRQRREQMASKGMFKLAYRGPTNKVNSLDL